MTIIQTLALFALALEFAIIGTILIVEIIDAQQKRSKKKIVNKIINDNNLSPIEKNEMIASLGYKTYTDYLNGDL